MKKNILTIITCLLLALSFSGGVFAEGNDVVSPQKDEHVLWDKTPIQFTIPVGSERLLTFSEPVELVNQDENLTADKVSIINDAGTLYIKALDSFQTTRVEVKLLSSNTVILVDLGTVKKGDDNPVTVLLPDTSKDDNASSDETTGDNQNSTQTVEPIISDVALVRFGIQSLYSPERVTKGSSAIHRVPMYTHKTVPLVYGGSTQAYPLISWRGGDRYVTAILVKNTAASLLEINPEGLRGNWEAVTMYPADTLKPMGKPGDRTTLYVVSKTPFNEALNENREVSQ